MGFVEGLLVITIVSALYIVPRVKRLWYYWRLYRYHKRIRQQQAKQEVQAHSVTVEVD